jgi:hypothetical protein
MKTTSHSDYELPLLLTIGECHRLLQSHSIRLSKHKNVRTVKHAVDMPGLSDSYRLEEYVDAELVSGEAISWCLEITVFGTRILVEADVTRIHADGQDVVARIGEYEYSTEGEYAAQLRQVAERLCSANPL